ncbi:MAG: response regulator [Dysgonamonadaceae bacterium]|nr:response regulator [Dysgonamonadaceae bacterium]
MIANCCTPYHVHGQQQNFYFYSLEVEDGLSQNMIYTILQDKQGFMWFGTQDGLNRYDGYRFTVYKKNANPKSIGSNNIFSLMQDDDETIWVGTSSGVYLYHPALDAFSPFDEKTADGEDIDGIVRDIKKDKRGNIWLAVSRKGLFCYSPEEQLHFYSLNHDYSDIHLRKLDFDPDGNVWIATYRNGLFMLDPATGNYAQFPVNKEEGFTSDNDINDVFLLNATTLALGTVNRGVLLFNMKDHTFSSLLEKDDDGKKLFVRRIFRSDTGKLWFGTETGVYIHDPQTKEIINLRHVYNDTYSISDNAIHSIYQDREGGMWVGTFFGGVNYFSPLYAQFEKYYPVKGANSISGKSISEFCEDDRHYIWIGTEDAGLNRFDPVTQTFTSGFIPANNIHTLLYEDNRLWVGTFSDGLYKMDLKTQRVRLYKNSSSPHSLNSDNIYSIYKDYSGTIWIGTMLGLHTYNEAADCFNRIQEQEINRQVNDILEDHKGKLWFATLGNGVFAFDKTGAGWVNYALTTGEGSGKMVNCLLKDRNHHLWAGTEGAGLFRLDKDSDAFVNVYTTQNGLPNNVVYQLVEDNMGNIWGSTNHGLFKLAPETGKISIYTHANGLLGDQFNYKSGFRSKSGKIYFGGIKGFVAFLPENLRGNNIPPILMVNSLQISNNEVEAGVNGSPLRQSITHTNEINLASGISNFSVGFAALSYVFPQGNSYAYKLDGRDKDWIYIGQQNKVTYSNLPPGKYILRLKAANIDGVWSEETILRINKLPPFYRTVWAYTTYVLLVVTLIGLLVRRSIRKIERRNRQAIHELEDRKEKELYHAKIKFFTNVTHEIRTPLSLIKLPLDEVMKQVDKVDANWENLSIIQRNTNRLLKLVNELLDFRKAETKGLHLNFVSTDILLLVRETVECFTPSAHLKGLVFDLDMPLGKFQADVDAEVLTKIISNLFSNALNHAKSVIGVRFTSGNGKFRLEVENDGEPVPPEYGKKIFEPFFKMDENRQGSGLGLSFARSLAELHEGVVCIDPKKAMTTFVIELPVHQQMAIRLMEDEEPVHDPDLLDEKITSINDSSNFKQRKTILLVEDNAEFLQFTANQLDTGYCILRAGDGAQAKEILDKEPVDLVISDIMMPGMNGIALCGEIKKNLKYSHIPVILLTAKTTLQSKIEGLKTGADEYIEKPFSMDYLKARIGNLLESRRKIRELYKRSPELAYDTIVHSKADEEFLNRLMEQIHAHLEDTDLNVDTLAAVMNMSRATLFRKVKSISELSPNDFIRLVRLKRAAELLKEKEYRVNEIAFIVGFSSLSYFSKCFYKQFGILPKDFERKK